MKFQRIDDLQVEGRRVFVRVDFNVPLDESGVITDDARIRAALPTLRELVERGGKLILASHLGRPKGQVVESLRLGPVATALCEFLGREVAALPDCIGPAVQEHVAAMGPGDVALLENVRFHGGETQCDETLSKEMVQLADCFVNDAFGTAHRAHASTVGVPRLLPANERAAGRLLEKELEAFGNVLAEPERPFVAVLGGAKVSDKILVVENLLDRVDALIIGGGMAYTFLKAQGHQIGNSMLQEEQLSVARSALAKAQQRGIPFLLPVDHIVAAEFKADAAAELVDRPDIPAGSMALDIGPKSIARFAKTLRDARTVVWNGPLGVFEWDAFATGSREVAETIAKSGSLSVVGGGDSLAVIKKFRLGAGFSHISTGGGASLEMLEGKALPGIEVL
jgi:phosphoglycerate kinase